MRRSLLVSSSIAAAAVIVAAGVFGAVHDGKAATPAAPAADADAVSAASKANLAQGIAAMQNHLRQSPQDSGGWATLGAAYVEQTRATANFTLLPLAQGALEQSLKLSPKDNADAHAGLAALDASRHEFAKSLNEADTALRINPYHPRALATRIDALVELGRYGDAAKAATLADDRAPGLSIDTRLSYLAELHGDTAGALKLMRLARGDTEGPGDIAFTEFHLGELVRVQGHVAAARAHYRAALKADPRFVAATVGMARTDVLLGDRAGALKLYADAVNALPSPEYLTAYAELLVVDGQRQAAQDQLAVVTASEQIARSNGVQADLEAALFEADHGSPTASLGYARAEWGRRHSIHAADALGWALHANGRNRDALAYARKANALGTQDSRLLYHRGEIERSLGMRAAALTDLRAALRIDPTFSYHDAVVARHDVRALEAAR